MLRLSVRLLTPIFFILISTSSSWAGRYALLIGIGDYRPPASSLPGPVNDVISLRGVLMEKYGFSGKNITTLINEEATKHNILNTLSSLETSTKHGDFIFVYFSGHGTSGQDRGDKALNLPIQHKTGALVPYDFEYFEDSPQKTLSTLIVGRLDLRPIFSELDKGRKLLVMFDSCFSGNTVRAVSKGIPKYMPLTFRSSYKTQSFGSSGQRLKFGGGREKEPYPYENIIYISAADENEKAEDLPGSYGTVDGKAHGALTNQLLIGLNGAADTNHNGAITYEELYQFLKRRVSGKHPHTPQVLYRDGYAGYKSPVFEKPMEAAPPAASAASVSRELRVKVEGEFPDPFMREIGAIMGVKIVGGDYDLLLREESGVPEKGSQRRVKKRKEGSFGLYLPSGDRLCLVHRKGEALNRIKRHAQVRELVGLKNPRQNFNIWLRAGSYEGKTVFYEGESVDFTIKSEENAWLLLLDIDPHGYVTVLLPESQDSPTRISRGGALELRELGEVEPPLGVEFLKLFAFKERAPEFGKFSYKLLDPGGPEFMELLNLIKGKVGWAEIVVELVSVKAIKN